MLLLELLGESDARAPSWQYPQHALQDQSQQLLSVPLSAAVAAASAVSAAPSIPEAWPSFLQPWHHAAVACLMQRDCPELASGSRS